MHRIEWCEGGVQLADIETKNVGENELYIRTKYFLVMLEQMRQVRQLFTSLQNKVSTKWVIVKRLEYSSVGNKFLNSC